MKTKPKIVTIGGGGGAPPIIKSLITAGYTGISAISAASDNGGRSGSVRTDERDRVISVGDLFRNLFALLPPNTTDIPAVQAFTSLANFTDGRGRNLGYTIYYALMEKYHNNFLEVQRQLEKLLAINFMGTAIPITLEPAHICFSTENGQTFMGEAELDRLSMAKDQVAEVWLDREVSATPEAVSALKHADYIVFCPGSLIGSLISHLLPQGVIEALKVSPAQKILITNLTSDRNQTHKISLKAYVEVFQKYTHLKKPIDTIICPDLSYFKFSQLYPEVSASYALEHSYFLGPDRHQLAEVKKMGVAIYPADIYIITRERHRVRHDPQKLASIFKAIIG